MDFLGNSKAAFFDFVVASADAVLPFGTLPAVSLLYMRATMHYYS